MKWYDFFKRHKDGRHGRVGGDLVALSSSKGQADSDRSCLRMFEEELARQSNGDWLSGSRDAQKSFSKCLIDTAKANGLFIPRPDWNSFGERRMLQSGESVIYTNPNQGLVYKVRDPFAKLHLKSQNLNHILYEHVFHNILFPDTRYSFVGISEEFDDVRIVLSQQFFFETDTPTQEQIDTYLASLGLLPEDRYYYGNEQVAVTDVNATGDNVLLASDGRLLFIDPIIKVKKDMSILS